MFRGPLHNAGADGRCTECGEPFPCPTGLATYEAVKRELEHPTVRSPEPAKAATPIVQPPLYAPRWEDLEDRGERCSQCLHWWVSHGSEPDPEGCGMPASSMDERERGEFKVCGCQERPTPGSEWEKRLAREAAYQAKHYDC